MPAINFIPFPDLLTEHLILRQLKMEDENEIFLLRSDERVNRFLDRARAASIEDARLFIQKINTGIVNSEGIYWAIVSKTGTALIGTICLFNLSGEKNTAEIGYELLPAFHGKGIMQEAISKVVDYGFDVMQLQTIEAVTHADNISSIKALEKNKFARDLPTENKLSSEEKSMNMVVYSLTGNAREKQIL